MTDDPFAGKLGQYWLKCANYWQAILRIGIPLILIVRGINYVEFRMAVRHSGARYPYFLSFWSEFIIDICIALVVSAVFCWMVRKFAALKQKNQLNLPRIQCLLHSSRAICVVAIAFWTFWLTFAVLDITGILHQKVDLWSIPAYGVVIWSFATLAKDCKQRLERLIYCIGIVQMSILATHAVIPASMAVTRFSQFVDAALSAIEIVLSATILLWHFRTRTGASDTREPT